MAGPFNPPDTPGPPPQDIFGGYPVASWQVGDSPVIRFPLVGALSEDLTNRIVRQVRPYRRGAKLDSTGFAEREFSLTALFNNTIVEAGLESNPRPLYPFMLRQLLEAFTLQQTGTLTLPTVGAVRCRALSAKRLEQVDARDQATVDLTFVEDNEEALLTAPFTLPSARATVAKNAAQTFFTLNREAGVADVDLFTMRERSSDVESRLLSAGRSVADLEAEARSLRWQMQRQRETQRQLADGLGILGTEEPRGSEFHRLSIRLEDTLGKATDEKFASRPRVRTFVVDVAVTSLFEIAARLKQDPQDLLDLNGERVPDPFYLEQGDVVRVFDTRGQAA